MAPQNNLQFTFLWKPYWLVRFKCIIHNMFDSDKWARGVLMKFVKTGPCWGKAPVLCVVFTLIFSFMLHRDRIASLCLRQTLKQDHMDCDKSIWWCANDPLHMSWCSLPYSCSVVLFIKLLPKADFITLKNCSLPGLKTVNYWCIPFSPHGFCPFCTFFPRRTSPPFSQRL